MNIVINELILHVLDTQIFTPVLSKGCIYLSDEINEYMITLFNNILATDDYKICSFKDTSKVFSLVKNQYDNLVEISRQIATSIFTIMLRNNSIPNGDLVVAYIVVDDVKYLAILKLNYRSEYIHHFENDLVNIIKQRTILPSEKNTMTEAILINLENNCVRITEKKYEIDGVKDYYLSTLVLDCSQSFSERSKLKIIQKVTEEIIRDSNKNINTASEVASLIINEADVENKLYVRQISEKIGKLYPVAEQVFEQSIISNGMDMDTEVSISNTTMKKMSKQALHTESGVEIRIPTNSQGDVEFINNPDGSISILIRNVKFR